MAWIDEANNKSEFPELDENYEEKEQDGQGCLLKQQVKHIIDIVSNYGCWEYQ